MFNNIFWSKYHWYYFVSFKNQYNINFLGIAFLVPLHIVLYNTILTKLFIKGDTLIGLNGLLSRIKIPINRITFVTIIRNPLKVGGREVILLTKSRDLIKLHYIINYNELIDKLEELDSRYYIK